MMDEIKQKAIIKVDNALRLTKEGLITIEEGMKLIVNCFEEVTE